MNADFANDAVYIQPCLGTIFLYNKYVIDFILLLKL